MVLGAASTWLGLCIFSLLLFLSSVSLTPLSLFPVCDVFLCCVITNYADAAIRFSRLIHLLR